MVNLSYRYNQWLVSDLLSTGVDSFGHISGVHYQNFAEWPQYVDALDRGELPLARGMKPTPHQLLVREMILQLKTGRLDANYFRRKFDVEIVADWRDVWQHDAADEMLTIEGDEIRLTRAGLLQVDALLPAFFEPEHRDVRYT